MLFISGIIGTFAIIDAVILVSGGEVPARMLALQLPIIFIASVLMAISEFSKTKRKD